MTGWSNAQLLQSLGWAILNSFWQMAVLWIVYACILQFFKTSPTLRYRIATASVLTGFAWFLATFTYFLDARTVSTIAIFDTSIPESNPILKTVLRSSSIAYLFLFIFPVVRLFRNWRFVRTLRRSGISKASHHYRLFTQKISAQLGIAQKVMIFASDIVKSPVTIGYLKPVILLPIAAFNNLSTQQVEAILLHELAHIRRFDYLVNFLISIIHTILYFNPFVRLFANSIEEDRESCCDELVLQFGYDRIGYASALLTLEKMSARLQVLTLCATGKNFLLTRIENIAGLPRKKQFRMHHAAGLIVGILCVVLLNSVMIVKDGKQNQFNMAYDDLGKVFNFFGKDGGAVRTSEPERTISSKNYVARYNLPAEASKTASAFASQIMNSQAIVNAEKMQNDAEDLAATSFIQVSQNDVDAALSADEKTEVSRTAEATRQIISSRQWELVNRVIGDALTDEEKKHARQEYEKAIAENIKLKNLEQSLKAGYNDLDWPKIRENVKMELAAIRLDSLENVYASALVQLDKARVEASQSLRVSLSPLPDQPAADIVRAEDSLRKKIETIRLVRHPRKKISL